MSYLSVEYLDGQFYDANSFAEIDIGRFAAYGMGMLFVGRCSFLFEDDEFTVAHRMRRRLVIGVEQLTKDCYVLQTNARKIFVFPDGRVVSMPEGGERDATYRRIALTPSEFAEWQRHASFLTAADYSGYTPVACAPDRSEKRQTGSEQGLRKEDK